MMARITWFGSLAAIALVTAGLQLDRETENTPALAPLVPEPFRNFAQTRIAADAVAGDDASLALAETERLVRRRPMPAEYLSLLAAAQARAGKVEDSDLTIQIAAQRGWREPLAQEAMMRLALAAGDEAEAARRYTALLLRQNPPVATLKELGPAVLGETGGPGQQAMIAIISDTDRWNRQFLRLGRSAIPAAAFADITAASILRGAQFDCGALRVTIDGLEREYPQASRRVTEAAARLCPDRRN